MDSLGHSQAAKVEKPAKADADAEPDDRLPATVEELKESKSGLVTFLFLSGKEKEDIANGKDCDPQDLCSASLRPDSANSTVLLPPPAGQNPTDASTRGFGHRGAPLTRRVLTVFPSENATC